MKTALFVLCVFLTLMCVVWAQKPANPFQEALKKSAGFDPKRDAAKDIQAAVARAKKEDKRVLIDVGGEWCIWCHKLEDFFEANKDATELRDKKFVLVKVNYSQDNKNEAVLSKYPKIPGYPHLFVLDAEGKLLKSQDTGELESGNHHDHDKVMAFLNKWAK